MILPSNGSAQRTDVQYGDENAMQVVLGFLSRAERSVDTLGDSTMPSIAVGVEPVRQFTVGLSRRGLELRSITEITKDNVQYCRELARYVQLRHMPGIKGSFAVRDGAEYVGTTVLEEARPVAQAISSSVKGMVEQHQYLFETLWSRAMPAQHRFREIEEGIDPEFMRVIMDPDEADGVYVDLARGIESEAFLLLPDSASLNRAHDLGVLHHMARASESGKAVVRIICPLDGGNREVASWLEKNAPGIEMLDAGGSKSTVLAVDGRRFFGAEHREGDAHGFLASIGFAAYSNSRPSVDSVRSFFELLWNSAALNERLKRADVMQKEFINIAAHELRSPIQPILGYAELLEALVPGSEEVKGIMRNALRLQQLTADLLDVARIEGNWLRLNKQRFSLNGVIAGIVRDAQGRSNASIVYRHGGDVEVHADRHRIAQVVSNLLDNAIKFTEGAITVESRKKGGHVVVAVSDEGPGIDPEIMPRLFTKFGTNSDKGTGLGLYISKGIVDAHGGQIWAENNVDGKGATFTVALP